MEKAINYFQGKIGLILFYWIVINGVLIFCFKNLAILFLLLYVVIITIFSVLLYNPSPILSDIKIMLQKIFIAFFGKALIDPKSFGYGKIASMGYMDIFMKKLMTCEVLAINDDICLSINSSRKELRIAFSKYVAFRYKIKLDNRNFKGLLEDSYVKKGLLLPYERECKKNKVTHTYRIVIITNKGQIYHNYPNRDKVYAGYSRKGDLIRFDESVVWDLPERKYPSPNKSCEDYEMFFPGLPEAAYEYHPKLCTDKNYKDHYGNGGFDKFNYVNYDDRKVKVSRFYVPLRSEHSNSFNFMGGLEFDIKCAFIGTYASNSNQGVRICVFASSDGGRSWYNKYEFGDVGDYAFQQGRGKIFGENWGNNIDFKDLLNGDVNGELFIQKRILNLPSDIDKEPETRYKWGPKLKIVRIKKSGKTSYFYTEGEHLLKTGNIVAFSSVSKDKYWFANNKVSDDFCDKGLFFKVEILNSFIFCAHEFVANPYSNIPCRHIHHINKEKDGYLLGTGEIYPNGWIFFLEQRKKDNGFVVNASDELIFHRLNSTKNSVQRTMGMLWNESTNEIIIASDHDILSRPKVDVPDGRKLSIERNSLGLYKGKFSDIDDFFKYHCILSLNEPTYFFKKINNIIIVCGQRGELYYSVEHSGSWSTVKLPEPFESCTGVTGTLILCGKYIFRVR